MAKGYAVVVGAVLTLVGILGFVRTEMFGLQFNTTHNAIHLLSGIIGLAAGLAGGGKGAKTFAQVFGVIYTIVAIAGFAHVQAVTDMLMLNTRYNLIHVAVGVLGLLAGFTGGKEATS
jgi:hypothetical protein